MALLNRNRSVKTGGLFLLCMFILEKELEILGAIALFTTIASLGGSQEDGFENYRTETRKHLNDLGKILSIH